MAENVAGAIDAGTFAVPHAKYAIELALAAQFRLLRAPDCGRGEILVDAALKANVAFAQERFGALELAVEPAQRRTAIAGNVARGVEPVAPVELLLHQAQAHQRLEAGDEDMAVAEVVFVVELDVAQRHRGWPSTVTSQFAPMASILPEGALLPLYRASTMDLKFPPSLPPARVGTSNPPY